MSGGRLWVWFALGIAACGGDPAGEVDSGGVDSGVPGADAAITGDGSLLEDGSLFEDGAATDGELMLIDGAIPPGPDGGVTPLDPINATVALGSRQQFRAMGPPNQVPVWSVDDVAGGDVLTGTIAADPNDPYVGIYSAPLDAEMLTAIHEISATFPKGEEGRGIVELVYPPPVIRNIFPAAIVAGSSSTTVEIHGSGFASATVVEIDGMPVDATLRGFERLDFVIDAGLLAAPTTHQIRVRTPAPGGGAATIVLPVFISRVVVDPGVDPNIPALFDAALVNPDINLRPAITYPQTDATAPIDFPAPAVSFTLPAPHNVCRVRFASGGAAIDHYIDPINRPANANPSGRLSPADWSSVVQGMAATITVEVACAEFSGGTLAGGISVSDSIRYRITRESAGGRIVYFSGFIEGLWRIDIGSFDAAGEPWIGPGTSFRLNTPTCIGCHSFSGNGGSMSYATLVNDLFQLGTINVANDVPSFGLQPAANQDAIWTSMHPNGRWVLSTNLARQTRLLDATTGQQVAVVPTGGLDSTLATWAPDGRSFAYVTGVEGVNGVTDFGAGVIWTMTFAVLNGVPTFGQPAMLVGPEVNGGTAYYPSYSPDSQWIAFCRAASGTAYNNPQAELWLIRANGNGAPVRLGRANLGPNLTNSWPRWAPSNSQNRFWLVFSSQRPYPPLIGTGPQQLWVSYIDTTLMPADPSSPAIWLSGQNPFTGNLTAEWTAAQ